MGWPASAWGELYFRDRLKEEQKERILQIFHDALICFEFETGEIDGEPVDIARTDDRIGYDRSAITGALEKAEGAVPMRDGSYIAFEDLDDECWYFERRDGVFVEVTGNYFLSGE